MTLTCEGLDKEIALAQEEYNQARDACYKDPKKLKLYIDAWQRHHDLVLQKRAREDETAVFAENF